MRGRLMSNYGLKTYTPEQTKEQWRESTKVRLFVMFSQVLILFLKQIVMLIYA